MPYPEEFPHNLLNIGRNFTRKELMSAYGKEIARNSAKKEEIANAFRVLSNLKLRLEYEILIPAENSDIKAELAQHMAGLVKTEFISGSGQPVCLPDPLAVITEEELAADFTDFIDEFPAVTECENYDNIKDINPPIVFDR
jgi:hypothetical protein